MTPIQLKEDPEKKKCENMTPIQLILDPEKTTTNLLNKAISTRLPRILLFIQILGQSSRDCNIY